MKKGKIKILYSSGYGVIDCNGAQVMFHTSVAPSGNLKEGDLVLFENEVVYRGLLGTRRWATIVLDAKN